MPGGFSWDPRPILRPGTRTQTHPHSQSSSRSYPVICHVARGRRISGRRCSTCLIAYLHVAHIREFETAARPRPNCGFLGSGYLPLLAHSTIPVLELQSLDNGVVNASVMNWSSILLWNPLGKVENVTEFGKADKVIYISMKYERKNFKR